MSGDFLGSLRELDDGYLACALGLDMGNLCGFVRPDSVADAPVKAMMESRLFGDLDMPGLPVVQVRMVKY